MKKTTAATLRKIPVLDIPGLSSFQFYHGNEPELELQGARAVALFVADDKFYELSERFNRNEAVNVMDYCNKQRQLKAKMFSLKLGVVR